MQLKSSFDIRCLQTCNFDLTRFKSVQEWDKIVKANVFGKKNNTDMWSRSEVYTGLQVKLNDQTSYEINQRVRLKSCKNYTLIVIWTVASKSIVWIEMRIYLQDWTCLMCSYRAEKSNPKNINYI